MIADRRINAGLFLLALASLAVEVLLTRIFDVILWPNLAFVIISGAICGLALGGLVEIVAPDVTARTERLSRIALAFGLSVWTLPLFMNAVPFSLNRAAREPFAQLVWFLLLYLMLLVPFFCVGLCMCRILSGAPQRVQRLYFWDLTGAAIGAAIVIPLIRPLGPERLLVVASLAAAGAAALFAETPRWRAVVIGVAALLLSLPSVIGARYLTLALHDDKRAASAAIALGRQEFSVWDPVSQIAVVDQPPEGKGAWDRGRKFIAYDGGTQKSNFFPFDGDFGALRRDLPARLMFQFWQRGVLAAHYLRRDTGHRALIIGSAGGQETKAALMYGAKEIDAVEMVRAVVDLATGPYAGYIGRIFEQPGVHVHVGEGRSFLRASGQTYDVIQVFSNYTSSSVAAGSGAVTPSYLMTTDAFAEYFSHLAPNGILQINHMFYPRLITTAATAWHTMGRRDFRGHVLVFERQHPEADYLPTVMIKMSSWTPAEVADARRFFSFPAVAEPPYSLVENPLDRGASFLADRFYSGTLTAADLRSVPYDVTAATDDRPFFRFVRRSLRRLETDRANGVDLATAWAMNSQMHDGWLPRDWAHLIAALAASGLYGLAFLLVPVTLSRVGREPWGGKVPTLLYFSLLGLAFITLELVFIQIFMKPIGYPVYAVATVITVMLVAAALGSAASGTIVGRDASRWALPFVGLLATGLALWMIYPPAFSRMLTWPIGARVLGAAGLMFPTAFFMGMPFPLGILEIAAKPRGAVAWAWSMNGLCTTLGGVATALMAVWLGFHLTMLAALGMYAAASACFAVLRRGRRATSVIVTRPVPTKAA
jgi:hypothetical protein